MFWLRLLHILFWFYISVGHIEIKYAGTRIGFIGYFKQIFLEVIEIVPVGSRLIDIGEGEEVCGLY